MSNVKYNPLNFSIERTWSGLDNALELSLLDELISWKQIPNFPKIGRCAYSLFEPMSIKRGEKQPLLVKLKGVGYKSHRNEINQPENVAMQNRNPHLGFDRIGAFIPICSDPAPLGGICLQRAIREFKVAEQLVAANCPSVMPLRVYKYTDPEMVFKHPITGSISSLGVVATALPTSSPYRTDITFTYQTHQAEERATVHRWRSQLGINNRNNAWASAQLLVKLNERIGRTLRKFSAAGFYRYSGAPDNFTYLPEYDEAFIVDLDSCRELAELNAMEKPLQIMRDAASVIAYLITYLTKPTIIEAWHFDKVIANNPFEAFLCGYFPEVDPCYIEKITRPITKYYRMVYTHTYKFHLQSSQKTNSISFLNFLENSFIRPWISRSETFANIMPVIYLIYNKSSLANQFPHQLRFYQLLKNILDYTSSEVMTHLNQRFSQCGLLQEVEF